MRLSDSAATPRSPGLAVRRARLPDAASRAIGAGVAALLLLAAIAGLGTLVPTDYVLVTPGSTLEVAKLVSVSGPSDGLRSRGQFILVSVRSIPASATLWMFGKLDPHAALVPREQARPPDMTEREYRMALDGMMSQSKLAAQVVALRAAGYDVQAAMQGAQVEQVAKGSPAEGVLAVGDVITALDGRPIRVNSDLTQAIAGYRPGDALQLTVRRGSETLRVALTAGAVPGDAGRARMGVTVSTHVDQAALPVNVTIRSQDLGGPSAGLVFALTIFDELVPEDLTRGQVIAGTGSLALDGTVEPIGGVEQKVYSAERRGVRYFLVPQENYEDARKVASKVEVLPVSSFDEALRLLRSLPET